MDLQELVGVLNELIDAGYTGDIKLLEQPSYPFIHDLDGIGVKDGTVYLIEGRQLEYGFKVEDFDERY